MPSDLRRYLEYNAKLKRQYGSVMNFVLQERLRWESVCMKGEAPFSDPGISHNSTFETDVVESCRADLLLRRHQDLVQ